MRYGCAQLQQPVGRNGSRGGMLMRRDGDVFWPSKGGARALSVRGVEVAVGGETLRVIIHIICYVIIIVVRCVHYPTPTAVAVYILPRFGRGPLSSYACVCVLVCVRLCACMSVRKRSV